jgi:hypothetical protein
MNESNNSSPIVVIVIICAVLLLLCMVVPLGVGAVFYLRLQHEAQAAAMAARDEAVAAQQAAQQAAMAQAEAARQAAEQMRLANERMAQALKAAPPMPPAIGELPLESRKLIYQQLKLVQTQFAELEKLAADDPAFAEALAVAKAQQPATMDQLMSSLKIDRAQLDAIMAEGEKEKW